MTPSELLIRAADLVRGTAAKATQGAWSACDLAPDGHPGVWWVNSEHSDDEGTTYGTVAELETTNPANDARWIALASPALAKHLETIFRAFVPMVRVRC